MFLAGHQRYRDVLAVLYFIPLLLSSAAIAITYKALLDPNFGLGAGLHLEFLDQDWLGNRKLAIGVVVFIVSWQFIPFHSLIYQGAVRQIPASMYEAAELDGAGRVRQFWSITLPQMQVHDHHLLDADGGRLADLLRPDLRAHRRRPGDATRVLALDMYKTGFQANLMGPASAIAVDPRAGRPRPRPAAAPARRRQRTTASWKAPDMATTATTGTAADERDRRHRGAAAAPPAATTGSAAGRGWVWLLIVMVPIYWIVITSFKTQANYYATNPLAPPTSPTLDNYQLVLENDFLQYFINSVIVTVGAIVPAVVISFMAAYAIVRGTAGSCRSFNACSCWAWPSRCRRRSSRST